MYIKIGPYKNWIGPYQLTDLLQKVGVSENQCDKLGMWLSGTKLANLCKWVDSKRKRKIQVRIDKYDTWSMDVTLSYIILPMLKQLKETKHSAADVDDKDVPKKLRSISSPKKKKNEIDHDPAGLIAKNDNWFARWDWVLDEMIWAFSLHLEEDSWPEKHNKRMQNGFRLFGKYYQNLWD